MKKGSDTLQFNYDASGTPLTVKHGDTLYYYVTNLQGDIIAILSSTGKTVATYSYDAWGNPVNLADYSGYLPQELENAIKELELTELLKQFIPTIHGVAYQVNSPSQNF